MYKLFFAILLFSLSHLLLGQAEPIIISGNYEGITFTRFVEKIEENYPIRIYFLPAWTEDLIVNVEVENASFAEVLNGIFEESELKYYQDSDGNIVLYQGVVISERLPQYLISETTKVEPIPDKEAEKITTAEKNYIEGLKVAELEMIRVGKKDKSSTNKEHVINGKIIDQATGESLTGATVFVKELGIGAATDLDGYFNIGLSEGKYLLEASSLSMRDKKFYLEVLSEGMITIGLDKELVNIKEVRVVANRNDNVKGIQMGYERISSKSMKEIPAVMGENDILKVATMLPGVQTAGDGSAGIYVRGGSADQNLFYVNKLPVYNTSHLFGFFSAFSPDIVNSFELYKSNIPAKFGGRISSVFDISTRQGNKKEFFGKGGISPITGHIAVEGPLIKDKSSFVLSYRSTYSNWLLDRVDDLNIQNSDVFFYDLSAAVNTEVNDKNVVKVFAYKSYDKFSLASTDDYNYSNTGGTVSWKHLFSSSLSVDVAAVLSQYNSGHSSKSNPSEAYQHDYQLNHNELKADFLYLSKNNHRISFGASGILYNLDRGSVLPYDSLSTRVPVDLGIEKGFESGLYISDEFTLLPNLSVLAGIRYSFYSQLGPTEINEYFPNSPKDVNSIKDTLHFSNNQFVKPYHGPEPRLALNYNLGWNNSVKASYNRIRQYIFMLSNTIALSPADQWKLTDYHIEPLSSDQISLGYYQDFPEKGLKSSVEVYKKWTNNVVEYKDGVDFISSDPTEMLLLQGKQESYGVEFILKKTTGKFTGWLSYTYSRSLVQVESDIITEQINYGNEYPSNYDKPHSLNFVSNLRFSRRISFSTIAVYSTGRPITYPIALYYYEGQELLHYSGRNEYRIPDYFRVDVSLNYEGNLNSKKWVHSSWMLNVYNLTGRKNAYSVYFEAEDGKIQGYKLSVFGQPLITLSWNFKFGNYASE